MRLRVLFAVGLLGLSLPLSPAHAQSGGVIIGVATFPTDCDGAVHDDGTFNGTLTGVLNGEVFVQAPVIGEGISHVEGSNIADPTGFAACALTGTAQGVLRVGGEYNVTFTMTHLAIVGIGTFGGDANGAGVGTGVPLGVGTGPGGPDSIELIIAFAGT